MGAEQVLHLRSGQLVGERDPRAHEFSVGLRAFEAAGSGTALGVGVLAALCGALLQKSVKAGLVIVGDVNADGDLAPVENAVGAAELAVRKGMTTVLMPVSAREQLNRAPDDLLTKIDIAYYADPREAMVKALIG